MLALPLRRPPLQSMAALQPRAWQWRWPAVAVAWQRPAGGRVAPQASRGRWTRRSAAPIHHLVQLRRQAMATTATSNGLCHSSPAESASKSDQQRSSRSSRHDRRSMPWSCTPTSICVCVPLEGDRKQTAMEKRGMGQLILVLICSRLCAHHGPDPPLTSPSDLLRPCRKLHPPPPPPQPHPLPPPHLPLSIHPPLPPLPGAWFVRAAPRPARARRFWARGRCGASPTSASTGSTSSRRCCIDTRQIQRQQERRQWRQWRMDPQRQQHLRAQQQAAAAAAAAARLIHLTLTLMSPSAARTRPFASAAWWAAWR
jgi:hypothetical protein